MPVPYFSLPRKARQGTMLASLALGIAVLGCTPEQQGSPGSADAVQLRIENLSKFTLEEVLVEAGGGGQGIYRQIETRQKSEYQAFDYTYRYAFVQTIVQGDTLRLQPTDYVGERRFQRGKFTLQINLIGDPPLFMTVNFRED